MTSAQHAAWIKGGKKWSAAQPVREFVDVLRRYDPNAEIGILGNNAHLDAQPPEDHTPYSVDGPAGVVKAFDYSGKNMDTLALHWINDARRGNIKLIKYINFNNLQWHHRDGFQVPHPNADNGHVHVSFLPTAVYTSIAGYNVTGQDMDLLSPLHGDTGLPGRNADAVLVDLENLRAFLYGILQPDGTIHAHDGLPLVNQPHADSVLGLLARWLAKQTFFTN